MRDWLTIELVLATLLVTSFSCVGLLALWAATSPRHWFIRTTIVLTVLSPLLLIPAYEPFVVFIIQSAVIVAGVAACRRRYAPSMLVAEPTGTRGLRFSLSTLLLLMVPAGTIAAVATRLPRLNFAAWTTVLLYGGIAGIATLIGASIFATQRRLLA